MTIRTICYKHRIYKTVIEYNKKGEGHVYCHMPLLLVEITFGKKIN